MLKTMIKFAIVASLTGGLFVGSLGRAHAIGIANGFIDNGIVKNGFIDNGIARNGGGNNGGGSNGVASGMTGFAIDGIELPAAAR